MVGLGLALLAYSSSQFTILATNKPACASYVCTSYGPCCVSVMHSLSYEGSKSPSVRRNYFSTTRTVVAKFLTFLLAYYCFDISLTCACLSGN